ncbi:MAG: transcription elongation factor GreA [Spirochaetales bacterium]|nr:transcription elongation factor GreA [Spirochaetales bacterium]
MAEKDLQSIREQLNEEKWTRATINSYTVTNFSKFDTIIDSCVKDNEGEELKEICDEHLSHTKNSIIALYVSGVLSYHLQDINDSNMIYLIEIFKDNHKENIVEFLSNRILDFGENKIALRFLAECYTDNTEADKKYKVWERLIKIDYEEAELVKLIAEKKEEEGDKDAAAEFYKKAIHRYINKKNFNQIKEIWNKLIEYNIDDIPFFLRIEKKISAAISNEKSVLLLEELNVRLLKKNDWDASIDILKRILDYDPQNDHARKQIVDCFRKKYSDHSQLEEYIKLSNITQNWRNIHEAIFDFEKHISFDAGAFVFHRSWGVGIIKSTKDDMITIDFAKKRGHSMSLKMATGALFNLPKYHIWVLKSIWPADKLHERVKNDVKWTLKILIKSFDNATSLKLIKNEMVPSVLTQGEWVTWSNEAKKILKTDPEFGNLPDKADIFVVRDNPITVEEKLYNKFKAEKNFYEKLKSVSEFIENADTESEFFSEMFSYVTNYIKKLSSINEQVVAAYLFLQDITRKYPYLNPGFEKSFEQIISEASDIYDIFDKIEDADIRRLFLENAKKLSNWADIYAEIFPKYLNKFIFDELLEAGHEDKIRKIILDIYERAKENRNAFIWLVKNIDDFEKYNISNEKVIITLLHLLDVTNREIDNKHNVSPNRKTAKQIETLLFANNLVKNFVLKAELDSVSRIYSILFDVKDIDPKERENIKDVILEKYPDFKFFDKVEGDVQRDIFSKGLLCVEQSYRAKQKELKYILEVEIPRNSKEIGAAIELGDLKENAEYKAGKEKQELLNISVSKLKKDLEKVHIVSEDDVEADKVNFGTKITMFDINKNEEQVFTILGPWESDPSINILSYLSPFGKAIYGLKEGEEKNFTINESNYNFRILHIEKADFSAFSTEKEIEVEFE